MKTSDDDVVLRGLLGGDTSEAFDGVVARYGGLVYRAIYRRVGNRMLAEEGAQAVFLALVRKGGGVGAGGSVAGWLLRAARYAAIDLLRKESCHARHERRASMLRPEAEPAEGGCGEEDAPLAAIEEALLSLATADREALVLRYHHGEPFARMGVALGTTEEGARKRTRRALERMRVLLRKRGIVATLAVIAGGLMGSRAEAAPMIGAARASAGAAGASAGAAEVADRLLGAFRAARMRLLGAVMGTLAAVLFVVGMVCGHAILGAGNGGPVVVENEVPMAATGEVAAPELAAPSLSLAPPMESTLFLSLVNVGAPGERRVMSEGDDYAAADASAGTCLVLGIAVARPGEGTEPAFRLSLEPPADMPAIRDLQPRGEFLLWNSVAVAGRPEPGAARWNGGEGGAPGKDVAGQVEAGGTGEVAAPRGVRTLVIIAAIPVPGLWRLRP